MMRFMETKPGVYEVPVFIGREGTPGPEVFPGLLVNEVREGGLSESYLLRCVNEIETERVELSFPGERLIFSPDRNIVERLLRDST